MLQLHVLLPVLKVNCSRLNKNVFFVSTDFKNHQSLKLLFIGKKVPLADFTDFPCINYFPHFKK
jgi:hypothetical protein